MFHPLIKLMAAKPQLLAAHLGGYAELLAAQAAEATTALRSRALLAVLAGLAALLAAALAGVAVLLLAVVPVADMPAPWLLAAAPAMPLLLALGCAWRLQHQPWAWTMGRCDPNSLLTWPCWRRWIDDRHRPAARRWRSCPAWR